MNKKWLIAAIAAGMTVTGSAGVYAGAKLDEIKAYLNRSIGVVVDGNPYWLRDGNGKTLSPITYQGLTYLPVRSIADALDVPITYDAANYKVRIGTGADSVSTPGDSGSNTGGNSSTPAPVETTIRPVNLPKDFPIPADAVIATTLDTDANGVKKAAFSYSTQESLETMGFVYNEYARIKRLDNASQAVSSTTVKISGRLGGTSPVSITGKPSTARPGFNIFTVTWSES
ncbi:hypothetical protein C2I18_16690 [Paenibacillus sp. PK3_47]|uniref:copper amine oxidase N-terminal domain-containing protein n=1 Tax=Paenibacillus sp. PK3_47 TaxID=2072642 RepID=UPI00201E0B94|nr:copper amine oxidase N-terminal domain-containing protein [Paenibacillus sp. PK3_47]UQZ35016.1 hypothetical protein C2I18_16690 [Paenibacillus sp. PK3_47]